MPASPPASPPPPVVLASQSPYRKALLGRLLRDFITAPQHVDETPRPEERPADLALRLARVKADAAAARHPGALVIGSDQVAALGRRALGKPGTADAAVEQLLQCSGQRVEFLTAVCVLGPGPGEPLLHLDVTRVSFRRFDRAEAERYVAADQPLDCAGSFRAEQRGVALMERLDSADPTAIEGLPLIWLAAALKDRRGPLF